MDSIVVFITFGYYTTNVIIGNVCGLNALECPSFYLTLKNAFNDDSLGFHQTSIVEQPNMHSQR